VLFPATSPPSRADRAPLLLAVGGVRYREGQEDQLAALGFALNVLVLWNTQYMHDAIGHLRRSGREIRDEHPARLSPLQHEHILMLGTFPFTLPHELADGQRRRLRIGDGSA